MARYLSKFEEFYQQTDPGNSMTPKQDENKEITQKLLCLNCGGKSIKENIKK